MPCKHQGGDPCPSCRETMLRIGYFHPRTHEERHIAREGLLPVIRVQRIVTPLQVKRTHLRPKEPKR